MIAGIMTALKEIELLEQTVPQKCETRQIWKTLTISFSNYPIKSAWISKWQKQIKFV
jgi:hypothetical protein